MGLTQSIENQENKIDSWMKQESNLVKIVKKDGYSEHQIKGKLRQIYHDPQKLKTGDYISKADNYDLFSKFDKR
jgi:hypothetical protein